MPLPHGVIGWSVVFYCGIAWSYSLVFFCFGEFDPFMTNRLSHFYQLDQSISVLKGCFGVVFSHFHLNLNITFCKQIAKTLISNALWGD